MTIKAQLFTALTLVLLASSSRAADPAPQGPGSLDSVPPMHRVAVLAVPSSSSAEGDVPKFIVEFDAWKTLLVDEGVLLKDEEWAGAVDLARVAIGKSDLFRVVDFPAGWSRKEKEPGWDPSDKNAPDKLVLARFTVGSRGRGVFLRLVDPYSGLSMAEAEAMATDMSMAIDKAISEMENEAAMFPWRCRVSGVSGDNIVINRGYLDGLREGQRFFGYSIKGDTELKSLVSDEESLMLNGARTGEYEITEAGRNFSKLKPVEDAPVLEPGDVLEIPEIRLDDRRRKSRGKRLWDNLYKD